MHTVWRWTRRLLMALVVLLVVGAVAILGYLHHLGTTPLGEEPTQPLLNWQQPLPPTPSAPADWEQRALADQSAAFDPDIFAAPPKEYRPWTRWWWPGNVVDSDELVREINVFSAQGFGGVEIQAIGTDVSDIDKADSRWGDNGWDTPAFYANVRAVLDAAKVLEMRVDLTAGSGWPSGGPHVGLQDGMHSLVHGERIVKGPQQLHEELPAPKMPVHWRVLSWLNLFMPMGAFATGHESLLTVVASRVQENNRSLNPLDIRDQIGLVPGSSLVLDAYLDEQGKLQWDVPEGEWVITAFYRIPGSEGGQAAIPRNTYVVDHFDSDRLNAHYNYLFRPDTALSDYFGKPLRGFFNDSFEFKEERLWPTEQFKAFEQQQGYDPRPYLQAVVQTGHDFSMYHWAKIEATHEYSLGDLGKRFEYDWEHSVSDSFIDRFIDGSRTWAEAHGLASRAQAYGFEFDLIKAAGHTSIPETEQQGGSLLFMKMPSSGAWLYGRPLVTAESFIHKRRAWMSTPAKVKAQAQQLFAAGVNQVIYHGSPYQIQDAKARGYLADGWYPFTSSAFSDDFSEQHPHWQQLAEVNTFIARQQYLLRLGKPEADVLVYYPWLGFPLEGIGEDAFLIAGQFDGEPSVSNETTLPVPLPVGHHDPREAWLAALWPQLQALEAQGLTWQWINPEKTAALSAQTGALQLGNARYQALLLHDIPAMSAPLAEHIADLAGQGAAVMVSGATPGRQGGLAVNTTGTLDASDDQRVVTAMKKLAANATDLTQLTATPVSYQAEGIQQVRRRLANGDLLIYLNNTLRQPQQLTLSLQPGFAAVSALDAWTGTTWPLAAQGNQAALTLPAYGARTVLVASSALADTRTASEQYLDAAQLAATTAITQWQLAAPHYAVELDQLVDWRTVPELASTDTAAVYRSQFRVENTGTGRFVLDLGEVYGVAKIRLNGTDIGTLSVVPFQLDIGDHLQNGINQLEVTLLPPRRNAQVEEIVAGASGLAARRVSTEKSTIGLIGPVSVQQWLAGSPASESASP